MGIEFAESRGAHAHLGALGVFSATMMFWEIVASLVFKLL
jgi:hypothetical protein